MKLLIKKIDDDGCLGLVPTYLDTPWDIEVVDSDDLAAFERALRGAHALISMSWKGKVPPAPGLRLLQLPGAGIDDVDFSLLAPGTAVCNCFEHEIGIAEYAMGAMLEWTIGIRRMDARLRKGDWTGSYLCGPLHGELYGKTLGILGYGRIGREVAQRALAFGMRVRACSRTPRSDASIGYVDGADGLLPMLQAADFVLVTAPLTPQTRGLIDAHALAAMRPGAVIINVSRGAIVDEKALYDALKRRIIAGAVIDVWYRYPSQGEAHGDPATLPFHELDNILMTPHASAWTEGLLPRRNRVIAENEVSAQANLPACGQVKRSGRSHNLNRLARGEPLRNVVRAAA